MAVRSDSIAEALQWSAGTHAYTDAISYIVNHSNPFFGQLLHSIDLDVGSKQQSLTSYLGYLPLLLIGVGRLQRRRGERWRPGSSFAYYS